MPDVSPLFQHLIDMRPVLGALRRTAAFEEAMAVARRDLLASFVELLGASSARAGHAERRAMQLAQFLTGGLFELMRWWLDSGMPESPQSMSRWFAELAEQALAARPVAAHGRKRANPAQKRPAQKRASQPAGRNSDK